MNNLFTIREFCVFARISIAHFQNLRSKGNTPDIVYLSPRCPRITNEAAMKWLTKKTQENIKAIHRTLPTPPPSECEDE